MKDIIIGLGKPKRVVKVNGNVKLENEPRMPKESKWAEDAQGKQMGQGCSRRKKWTKGVHKQYNGSRKPKVT